MVSSGGEGGLLQEHLTPHHNQRLLNPEKVDRGVFRRAESIASDGESMRLLVVEIFRKSNLVGCDVGPIRLAIASGLRHGWE